MPKSNWLTSDDPTKLLKLVRGKASERKHRLFAMACFGRDILFSGDQSCIQVFLVADRFADDDAPVDEIQHAELIADAACANMTGERRFAWEAATAAVYCASLRSECWQWATTAAKGSATDLSHQATTKNDQTDERLIRLAMIRCVYGNSFRPVVADSKWLSSTVIGIAEGIYAERAFDRLPILADALMDAGCEHPDVLDHCRSAGPHVRGCWVVDLILGKK